jgi:lysophospholipase L1-like esterase
MAVQSIGAHTVDLSVASDANGVRIVNSNGTDALVPVFTGDTGSGGTAGLIPAPPAGSAAAGLVLGANGSYVPAPVFSLQNYKPTSLQRWRMAKNNARLGIANAAVACVGDSTTFGVGADATTANWRKNSPIAKLNALIGSSSRAIFGTGNSDGNAGQTSDNRISVTGDWTYGAATGNALVGLYFMVSNSIGSVFSFAVDGSTDTADIYYVPFNGSMTVNVDGGATIATTPANSAYSLQKLTATYAAGTHTINVVNNDATHSARLFGVNAYSNATKSIHCFNWGGRGQTTTNWINTQSPYSCLTAIQYFQPILTIINLGINDWGAGAIPVATTITNLQALINGITSFSDIILVTPQQTHSSAVSIATQTPYINAIKALGVSNNIPVLDFWTRNPWNTSFTSDDYHPNAQGYYDLADAYFSAMFADGKSAF